MSLILDEHRLYLSDHPRVHALAAAIAQVVQPGDVVVDLGAGTGILGLLACRAGAGRVYAVEEGGMLALAREIYRANGFEDRVVFVKGLSTTIDLPERVDVVVADQIGRFGFDAGLFEYFSDARERFLKPDGAMMPSSITLEAAPVEHRSGWDQVEFWKRPIERFTVAPAHEIALNTGYPAKFNGDQLLAPPTRLWTLPAWACVRSPLKIDFEARIARAGTMHGVGGWFVAELADGVFMSNSPTTESRIDRHNVFFPMRRPVEVAPDDAVRISLQILPGDMLVNWTVEISCGSGAGPEPKARFSHSTLNGMLIPREELLRTSLSFVPRRTPRGDARLSVLSLCDGVRSLAEIEQEIYRRHNDLFRAPQDAAVFVAEVVRHYSL